MDTHHQQGDDMTKPRDTTTTSSTTTTTTSPPTTTTTEPPPDTTEPETTTTLPPPVDTTVPEEGCPAGQYPQGPTGDEPCGPTDLCSGDGVTRNWSLLPCDTTPASTTTTVGDTPRLPETGTATPEIAVLAGVMLLAGALIVKVAR